MALAAAALLALAVGDSIVVVAVAAVAVALAAAAFSSSMRAESANTLLYVGQPEQALVPPVPSQRPSPGQVPPEAEV